MLAFPKKDPFKEMVSKISLETMLQLLPSMFSQNQFLKSRLLPTAWVRFARSIVKTHKI